MTTPKTSNVNLNTVCDQFILHYRAMGFKKSTVSHRRAMTKRITEKLNKLGVNSVNQITSDIIEQFTLDLREQGRLTDRGSYSDSYLYSIMSAMRGLMNFAYQRGYTTRRLTIELPKVRRKRRQCLNVAEKEAMHASHSSDRIKVIYLVLVSSGTRPNEVVPLNWKDLDLHVGG